MVKWGQKNGGIPMQKIGFYPAEPQKSKINSCLSKSKVDLSHALNAKEADQGYYCDSAIINDQTDISIALLCHLQYAVSIMWSKMVPPTLGITSAF